MDSLGEERCWTEINLAAVWHNARVARERTGAELVAVVKANAYGHGLVEIARALHEEAAVFGVANLQEATELRESGIVRPILILGPALPNERAAINSQGFIPSVSDFNEACAFAGNPSGINFAIDTGMGRMGCWQEEAVAEFEKIARIPRLKVHSISTHLPVADEDENFTREELARFEALVRQMRTRVPDGYKVHVLPSAGILGYAPSGLEMVRAGLMLYGSSPLPNEQRWLQPAMTWKTRIALLRDVPAGRSVSYGRTFVTPRSMRLATIGVGYADGFPRALSGRDAVVLIRETRCPIVGRITMDLTVVEVGAVPEAEVGDEVVLIGRQGAEEIFAAEVAARAGTIAWEIFTGIGSRVRRVYL